MANSLAYWRHHLDPRPILAHPHVPLASTLMGVADSLGAVLNLLATLSDDRAEEKDFGVAVAGMAVDYTLKVLRHVGLGDDSPAPPLLNLKMAGIALENLLATVEFYLAEWREGLRDQPHDESAAVPEAPDTPAATPSGLIIDPGTFTVTYKGKPCYLGNTMAFWLIERLGRARGVFLTIRELIQDVWKGKAVSDGAVQHQVSNLRTAFRAAGIEGIEFESQPDCYRLLLR